MDKQRIIEYFNRRAEGWDDNMKLSVPIVDRLLDGARLRRGDTVLDVACGTGVMFDMYAQRGASSVTAIDISPEMVSIARRKKCKIPVEVICGDAETFDFGKTFDRCVIYNAFPHFCNPEALFASLSGFIRVGGTISVCHGMSEEQLKKHHSTRPSFIFYELPDVFEMSRLMAPYFRIVKTVSDEHMYQVTGEKL